MFNDRIIRISFLISLSGHLLLLGMPGFNLNKSQPKKPEEIPVQIEIEIPPLLPKIDVMGEKKKLPKIEHQNTRLPVHQSAEYQEKRALQQEVKKIRDKNTGALVHECPGALEKEAIFRYQDMIKQRIESCRRYPNWAKEQGIEGAVYIVFTVLSNGSNRDVKIVHSSGSMILDEEAIATIKRANPFPPIPKEISNSFVRMDISIVFTLK